MLCTNDINYLDAEILVGYYAGKPVLIPAITLEAAHDNFSSILFKKNNSQNVYVMKWQLTKHKVKL